MEKAAKLLMLFLCAIAAAAVVPAAARALDERRPLTPPDWGLLPPLINIDPEKKACWAALHRVPGCTEDILGLLLEEGAPLSAACCDAVQRAGEGCLRRVFPAPSAGDFPQVVKAICSSAAAPAPAPR